MTKNIQIAYEEGLSDPLEQMLEENDGDSQRLQTEGPFFILRDNSNECLYYCDQPFTLEEARKAHWED